MSESRQQVWIDAPKEVVWGLISDVNRHPEWWPRVVEVECEGLEAGCTYRQVFKTPLGRDEMSIRVDRMEGPEELLIRCVNTGTFFHVVLTEAQGGTFVEGRAGMDPLGVSNKVFDALAGKRFFRHWLQDSLEAMDRVACERARAAPAS